MPSLQLDDLNPAQRAAVLAPVGPILILAGAGSGKTRVLTYRIAHMIAQGNAVAHSMLAVTFTNKAAAEMRERVARLVGDAGELPWVSTFHSACARILRAEAHRLGFDRSFSILDEGDSSSLMRRVIEESNLPNLPPIEICRARIEQAKNEGTTPEELASRSDAERDSAIAELYRMYQARMRTINAMDFSDLQLHALTVLREFPEALERWQGRAESLLVDEYQDTNHVQYLIVKTLSQRSGNICVVGDEDQSIYRWRGADIRNILDFERDYPAAQVFKLEQNYRSTKTIIAAAAAVISNNSERKPKSLWTDNEAGFVGREIAQLTASGKLRPADIVVFYRVNAQSRVIEEALVRRRIPYYIVGGVRFYEQRDVKDLLAYLRVIANPADIVSLERMASTPSRGIGAKTIEAIAEVAARENIAALEAMGRLETVSRVALRSAKAAGALYAWMRDLSARSQEMSVRRVLEEVVAHSGFEGYLDTLDDAAARKQNLAEMLGAAASFDKEIGDGGLAEFLERIALVNDADQIQNAAGGRVALMTLHTSKGLEYPAVFIAGMEEGLFPHSRSVDSADEVEEERRLCYVGMTRARRILYLSNTISRELYGRRDQARPSRFIAEIDSTLIRRIAPPGPATPIRPLTSGDSYVDYSDSQVSSGDESGGDPMGIGARVVHPTFGRGIVRRREGRGESSKAWVNFDRGGMKLLVLKFANLQPLDD
jgi:DNA helicase-2/ATP-dependent DNA helicase PcrA